MPLPTLACTISDAGIAAPTFDEILQSLRESFQAIYGSDAYISADSQDGQWLAVIARAQDDTNQATIATWNAFRPSFAQGAGLDSAIKLNGISRRLPSNSVVDLTIVGTANTTITNGVAQDQNGNKWDLPSPVVIPEAGTIVVTAVAQEAGAVVAPAGSVTAIATPIVGWQFVENEEDALPGTPVESDAALRRRQTTAASLPANSNLGGLLSALEDIDTVGRVRIYENETGGVDANGLVAHSIAVVLEGGNVLDIATAIGQKKAPGCNLNGDVTQSYTDPKTGISYDGIANPIIRFYRITNTPVVVAIEVKTADGWNDSVGAEIQQAVADYINALGIGEKVLFSRLYVPANLGGAGHASTYHVTSLLLNGGVLDVAIAFEHAASIAPADVLISFAP